MPMHAGKLLPLFILLGLLIGCDFVYKVQVRDKYTNDPLPSIPVHIDVLGDSLNKNTGIDGIAIFTINSQYENKYGDLSIDGIPGYKPYVQSIQLREGTDIVLLEPMTPTATPTITSTPTPTITSTPTPTTTPTPTPTTTPTLTPTLSCEILEDFEPEEEVIMWSPDDDVFDFLRTTENSFSAPNSYRITYELTDTHQFIAADLERLNEEMRIFNGYQTLQVWVLGSTPILLKLEFENGEESDVTTQVSSDPEVWSALSFDISQVQSVASVSVRQLKFFISPGDKSASGVVFLDNISLCK